jgi:hypothetical protein
MTIQANFPAIKPSLLLDFANTKQLDSRITYTRASTATFYNGVSTSMAEQNLFTYSQEFENAVWTYSNATLTANTTTAPDGTSTADSLIETATTGEHKLFRAFQYVGDFVSPFTVSVFVKANTRSIAYLSNGSGSAGAVFFNLSTGTIGSNTYPSNITNTVITSAGNGWYRISALFTNGGGGGRQIGFGLTSTDGVISYAGDGTSSIYGWGFQLEQRSAVTAYTATTTQAITNYIPALQSAASGVARFDNNPTTGESLGLLIEESRTNLAVYSQTFDASNWTQLNVSKDINVAIAPDGTQTTTLLRPNSTSGSHSVYSNRTPTATNSYTTSVFVKAAGLTWAVVGAVNTGTVYVNLSTGALGTISGTGASATSTSVGNGWWRVTYTVPASTNDGPYVGAATSNGGGSFAGDGFNGIFIWGGQYEAGAFATSYIPTVASQVTRAADAASMTGTNFSSWYNQGEGTLYISGSNNGSTSVVDRSPVYVEIYDGVSRSVRVDREAATNNLRAFVSTNSTTFSNIATNGAAIQAAVAFSASTGIASANAAIGSSLVFNKTIVTKMAIGDNGVGNTSPLNGTIKKIAFYPIRVSNTNLQALTS